MSAAGPTDPALLRFVGSHFHIPSFRRVLPLERVARDLQPTQLDTRSPNDLIERISKQKRDLAGEGGLEETEKRRSRAFSLCKSSLLIDNYQ